MSSSITIRGYRAGFIFVICLFGAVAGFTLFAELRTNGRVDALVQQAIDRDLLIGRIRVDAFNLEAAVDNHIQAASDEERAAADDKMAHILEDISVGIHDYTHELPPGETDVWNQFNAASQALAAQARKAVTFSNRREAERARRHLVEKIRPLTANLDVLAERLSAKNGVETQRLLDQVEQLRFRSSEVGLGVAVLAIALALLVGWRVTDLIQKQEATIRDQVAELDRRNRELDSFASRVAHDLVSPLAPLKGYLTLIRRSSSVSDPQVREMLTQAEASAARMTELIEALLRFCRAGTPTENAVSDLDTAVTTLLLEVSQTAAAQHVELVRHIEPNIPVPCSAQLLQSIAQNVLSNAVKYTAGRRDAKVVVRVSREQDEGVLDVSDNGQGMSEATQRMLFQPFFRAPEARGLPGHGLGLATTKRLVEAHGGSIVVRSQFDVGTQVTVRFPLALHSTPVQPPAPLRDRTSAAAKPAPA